jgi:hypothetical protein
LTPGLIFGLILAANLFVFLRREWESNHRAADYSRINLPLDVPTLRDWRIRSNRFSPRISWNKHPSLWQVIREGTLSLTLLRVYKMIKRIILTGIILNMTGVVPAAHNETLDSKPTMERDVHMASGALTLWYTQPAADWTQVLPIGDGRLGAMVYGGLSRNTFSSTKTRSGAAAPTATTIKTCRPMNGS